MWVVQITNLNLINREFLQVSRQIFRCLKLRENSGKTDYLKYVVNIMPGRNRIIKM